MPIYEYRCQRCGHVFEKLVRSINSGPGTVECEQCHGLEVEKMVSAVACHGLTKGGGDSHTHNSGSSCGSCSGSHCSTCK